MGRITKGQMKQKDSGMTNLISLGDRPLEERKRISQMGIEARRKNKEQKMALQSCMKQLLNMKVSSDKQKQLLRAFGFKDEDLSNKTILMVALFKKGLTGDVSAIKEITEMMDKLDMYNETGKTATGSVTINIIPKGNQYIPNDEDRRAIEEVEHETEEWIYKDEEQDEWDA